MEKIRNQLRCTVCGAEVYTISKERSCYKCESNMIFIKTVEKKRVFRKT